MSHPPSARLVLSFYHQDSRASIMIKMLVKKCQCFPSPFGIRKVNKLRRVDTVFYDNSISRLSFRYWYSLTIKIAFLREMQYLDLVSVFLLTAKCEFKTRCLVAFRYLLSRSRYHEELHQEDEAARCDRQNRRFICIPVLAALFSASVPFYSPWNRSFRSRPLSAPFSRAAR